MESYINKSWYTNMRIGFQEIFTSWQSCNGLQQLLAKIPGSFILPTAADWLSFNAFKHFQTLAWLGLRIVGRLVAYMQWISHARKQCNTCTACDRLLSRSINVIYGCLAHANWTCLQRNVTWLWHPRIWTNNRYLCWHVVLSDFCNHCGLLDTPIISSYLSILA